MLYFRCGIRFALAAVASFLAASIWFSILVGTFNACFARLRYAIVSYLFICVGYFYPYPCDLLFGLTTWPLCEAVASRPAAFDLDLDIGIKRFNNGRHSVIHQISGCPLDY